MSNGVSIAQETVLELSGRETSPQCQIYGSLIACSLEANSFLIVVASLWLVSNSRWNRWVVHADTCRLLQSKHGQALTEPSELERHDLKRGWHVRDETSGKIHPWLSPLALLPF